MIGSGEDSGFKKSNTINRRMFIFAAAKAVVFCGIVGRLFSLQITENKKPNQKILIYSAAILIGAILIFSLI